MNTFGENLRVTTFGESHGIAIGGVIDGFPSGFRINFESLYEEIAKRAPGSSQLVSLRKEKDIPEFLSGITEDGVTLGTPIGFIIRNNDHRSNDYNELKNKYRPNHADFTYEVKYGIRDHRGGGRASARETANWVVAGTLAQQWLSQMHGIWIESVLSGAGKVSFIGTLTKSIAEGKFNFSELSLTDQDNVKIRGEIEKVASEGDSVGGTVTCIIKGLPPGIGSPVSDKLQSHLAQVMLSINAAKGFEYGLGFQSAQKRGSEVLDIYRVGAEVYTETNYSGGIQGGITNGMPVFFNVAFKPTPTIFREVETITKDKKKTTIVMKGRHDPCVAVRAVPVVKAMAALVIADFLL